MFTIVLVRIMIGNLLPIGTLDVATSRHQILIIVTTLFYIDELHLIIATLIISSDNKRKNWMPHQYAIHPMMVQRHFRLLIRIFIKGQN